MGEWNRLTKKIALEQLRPEQSNAIREHIEAYKLEPDLGHYLACIETASTKKKKGLFGGGTPSQTVQVAIITPAWLIVAAQGETPDSLGVLSIQLKDATAIDYKDDPGYRLLPDTGVHVRGTYTGRVGMQGTTEMSSFIPLGEEPAAGEFKALLFERIADAKK